MAPQASQTWGWNLSTAPHGPHPSSQHEHAHKCCKLDIRQLSSGGLGVKRSVYSIPFLYSAARAP